MDKTEIYPLIYIATFLVFYSVLVSSVASVIYFDSSYSDAPQIEHFTPDDLYTYYDIDYANPKSGLEDQQIYWINSTDTHVYGFSQVVHWYAGGLPNVDVVFNLWSDGYYITYEQMKEGAWFGYDHVDGDIGKSQLLSLIGESATNTQYDLKISLLHNYRMTFISQNNESIYNAIDNDNYKVVFGEPTVNITVNQESGLDALIDILTFNVPNINQGLQIFMATPIYIMMTYLILRIISWFVPLVPGGG